MQSKEVADGSPEVNTRSAQVVGHLDGLGTTLIELYEAGAEHSIKTELLDQVVSIIRRKKKTG
jgi:hypothetical protein